MPRDLVELTKQIKAANDIVDVISDRLSIKKVGNQWKCICPFHNDTNPSLTVDKKYQNYKCWACGAHGDVFTFVEKYERVNFAEARNMLAQRAGISIDDPTPQDGHKSRLFEVMKWAQALYHDEYINGPSAERARHYIGTRHLSGASARQFGVGFAPTDYGWLERAAQKDGISQELLVEVGLLGSREESQGVWDRFRDRVMFPIRDIQGRTIGFGGRILPDSPLKDRAPKYYNTADTLLFNKSDNVFGIDLARHAGAGAGYLAIVEGYTDVMMAHQCGIANVVATMGTALNDRHLSQLRRHVHKVVMVFDADDGGLSGVDRALEMFIAHDFELAVATLPKGLDPADLLAEADGVSTFKDILADAADALDFKLNSLLMSEAKTVEGSRRMLDAVLGILAMAPPVPNQSTQMKRELMLTRLSQRLGLQMSTVTSRLRELQADRKRGDRTTAPRDEPVIVTVQPTTPAAAVNAPASILERQLIQLLLAEPSLIPDAFSRVDPETVAHTGIRRMIVELFGLHESGNHADLDGLRFRLLDRPELFEAAMKLQDVGRSIPDRPLYLNKIIDGFAGQRRAAASRIVKEQLLAVGDDDDAAMTLLRRLQGPE